MIAATEWSVRFRLASGLEVYGLPTENFYGGHWDLGPTWNYVVMTDPPFLVDAGRRGQGRKLIAMLEFAGLKPSDLGFVLISHGHEDHDGGLGELAQKTGLENSGPPHLRAADSPLSQPGTQWGQTAVSRKMLALFHAGVFFQRVLPGLSSRTPGA